MLWRTEEITDIKIRRFQTREIKAEKSKYLKKSENKFLRIFLTRGLNSSKREKQEQNPLLDTL